MVFKRGCEVLALDTDGTRCSALDGSACQVDAWRSEAVAPVFGGGCCFYWSEEAVFAGVLANTRLATHGQ